jgi:8-oxo-dGTP diphosphatase
MDQEQSPRLTVDLIIRVEGTANGIVLVRRKNPPFGWALPGGFVDYGETVEAASAREALEETSLKVKLNRQFHVYSDPARDPRGHTVSVVFLASATGEPVGADDAIEARVFDLNALPAEIAFDHRQIVTDYLAKLY